VVLEGRLAGLIVLGFPGGHAPVEDEVSLLRDLADRLAVALATAARDQALYQSAHYDALTQLPNRSLFLGELARELSRAEPATGCSSAPRIASARACARPIWSGDWAATSSPSCCRRCATRPMPRRSPGT
jgi:GAF domain-containing protein